LRLKQEFERIQRESLRNEVKVEMLQEQLEKTERRVKELLEERAQLDREIGSMQSNLKKNEHDD